MCGRIKEYETCLGILKIVHFDSVSSERFFSLYLSSYVSIPYTFFVLASFIMHIEIRCMQLVAINGRKNFIKKRVTSKRALT